MSKDDLPTAPELTSSEEPKSQSTKSDVTEQAEVGPKLSKDEAILKSASDNMDDAEETDRSAPHVAKEKTTKPKKNHKKLLVVLLVVLLLAAAGLAGWYFVLKDNTTTGNNSATSPQSQAGDSSPSATPVTYEPDAVAYAFKANDGDPLSAYYRPAAGGERKEAQKLDRDYYPAVHDVRGQNVVFANDAKAYASTDGGKTYAAIFSTNTDAPITSLKLSSDGSRVAIATVPSVGEPSKGKVISVNLQGKDVKDLFTAEIRAVYLLGWTESKAVYYESCYACDGGPGPFKVRDLKTDKVEDVLPGLDLETAGYRFVVSQDVSTFLYVENTYDANLPGDHISGQYHGAPYKVTSVDVDSNKATVLATIGTKSEKNPNGTDKFREFHIGFLVGTSTPYYAEGTSIYKVSAGASTQIFTADKPILGVHFASDKNIFVSTGTDQSDFLLSNYSVADKKSTQIFSGDNNTTVFGITTK